MAGQVRDLSHVRHLGSCAELANDDLREEVELAVDLGPGNDAEASLQASGRRPAFLQAGALLPPGALTNASCPWVYDCARSACSSRNRRRPISAPVIQARDPLHLCREEVYFALAASLDQDGSGKSFR